MRRIRLLAGLVALALVLAPGLADARAGGGGSMGSRGSNTYSRPPATTTAPGAAQPMQRTQTPQAAPTTAPGTSPAAQPGFAGRSPFMSGLMGGLLGAGIGGLLFGGGLFHGISGFGSFLGFLLQIFLLVLIGRFVWRRIFRQPALAGGAMFARSPDPDAGVRPMGGGGGAPQVAALAVGPADYQAFEQLLKAVQAAWSAHDVNALRAVATPEMVSYFAEQMAEQTSGGVRNTVTDVHLEQGDLAESWAEQGREYATVAMRFSMIDATRDASGRVVEGDPTRRTEATEIWTFMRVPGGRWVLSAIQQAR
ncbi:Tim44 domain-containing protein [Limobrevibacterium gyesilva]|uniref:TIM44-like domain-containing protein n=1 Tax=Limobrevibacterium gyesilva TaxID=2991712 RepID=A0AA41YN43_9PROT|nr:TIM44-like domain-containing protein [Limobrevibacterium gyesilva]MCW3473350.1 TIM44-like domain-containing protein [Limobrevibacterium gyesilva]